MRQAGKVIDFHVHPYLSQQEFMGLYGEVFQPDTGQAVKDLEEAGITHICGSVIERGRDIDREGFGPIRELNRKALKLREVYGDFYTPGFHVHPGYVKESCEEIAYMSEQGVRLIGELVPYMHGWKDYSNQSFGEILDTAGQYGMIVSFHTVNEEQEEMERMLAAHPDVIFVAAHPGERESYLQQIERMRKYKNLYLDLSGTGLFRYGMLAYGVKTLGPERFLFGTDYPICNPRMYVQAVLQEHISDAAREAVLYGNAARLLEIEG